MDLCKVPGVNIFMEQKLICFFSISNFSHCFLFFSGVLVNGHLYVNMKNQDQVLIDGLLENHVGLAFVCERRDSAMTIFLICLYRDFLPAFAWSLDAVAYH